MQKHLLRLDEAAEMLSLSRAKIYLLVNEGELEMLKVGRASRIPYASLVDFIARRSAAGKRAGA